MTKDGQLGEVFVAGKKYVSYNILTQVSMRIVSFICNAVILRSIPEYVFGVVNVRLLLLYTTIHCFCREPLRRCCMGKLNTQKDIWKVINVLWIPIPLCIITGLTFRAVWLCMLSIPDPSKVWNYEIAVNVIVISLLIEVLAEPLFIVGLNFNFIKLKVITEGVYNITRSLTMAFLVSKYNQFGIDAFCYSQILSSSLYTLTYYVYFWVYFSKRNILNDTCVMPIKSMLEILPKFRKEFIDKETIILAWSFFKQTLLKQLLTEGEKYLMTFFSLLDFSEQGIYEVVNNLGSLVARLIFLPIEESTYNMFSILLQRKPVHMQKEENVKISVKVLQNVFKLMVLFGMTCFIFGVPYSKTLLFLYGGHSLSESKALHLLKWHCFYTIFIAINGIMESFVFAVMTSTQIDRRNILTVLLSVCFLFLAYFLTNVFGAVGFIIANCVNMGLRTYFSFDYIIKYFNRGTFTWFRDEALPYSVALWASYALCFVITSLSDVFFCCTDGMIYIFLHILVGFSCSIFVAALIYNVEKEFVKFVAFNWFQDLSKKAK